MDRIMTMLIEFPTYTWNCDCKALSNHVLLDAANPSWKVLLLLSFQNVDENPKYLRNVM